MESDDDWSSRMPMQVDQLDIRIYCNQGQERIHSRLWNFAHQSRPKSLLRSP
jgi:hypothetical protein